jgi:hypothetical protein
MTKERFHDLDIRGDHSALLYEWYQENNKGIGKSFGFHKFCVLFNMWAQTYVGLFGRKTFINQCLDNIKNKVT